MLSSVLVKKWRGEAFISSPRVSSLITADVKSSYSDLCGVTQGVNEGGLHGGQEDVHHETFPQTIQLYVVSKDPDIYFWVSVLNLPAV